jgi:hypothetical protein
VSVSDVEGRPPRDASREPAKELAKEGLTRLDQSALLELAEMVQRADGGDLMRTLLQALVDAEATARIGAGPHERTATRTTQRHGTRDKNRDHPGRRCDGEDPQDGPARSSRRCPSPADVSTCRCTRSSCRPRWLV